MKDKAFTFLGLLVVVALLGYAIDESCDPGSFLLIDLFEKLDASWIKKFFVGASLVSAAYLIWAGSSERRQPD